MTHAPVDLRARRLNGLPVEHSAEGVHWARRVLTNRWLWAVLAFTAVFAGCLAWMYALTTKETPVQGGVIPGLNLSAIRRSAGLALPTLAAWVVLFLAVDRFRPLRPPLWWIALGWGGAVATAASMQINTWAGQQMAIVGNGDPALGARTAVFVAPFVEEATKATILFWIAMALRSRLVTPLQAVCLGGLSGAGFAYVENILYYSRAIVYASQTIEAGDPEAALAEIVFLRGVKTAFGHPLFTALSAVALVIALRSRSKVVRVLAPLVGFVTAAGLHMAFNFLASVGTGSDMLALFGWLTVLSLLVRLLLQIPAEGRRHADRLTDYVRMGWLPEESVPAFSRLRTRGRSLLHAASRGWRSLVATVRLQRTASELVHLRDAQVRGLVDAAADDRARELLARVVVLTPEAVTDPALQPFRWPPVRAWLGRVRGWRPGVIRGSASSTPNLPPLGSPSYSPVDPRWAPPKG